MIVMCLCAVVGVQAQTIQNGSTWWDGSVLYTALVQGNTVKMEGVGEHEGGFRFQLTKLANKSGEYVLTGSEEEADALRAKVGWRVQYVRQEGMYFLAVRNPKGDAVWQLTLTPDNLQNCLAQQRDAEKREVGWLLQHWLMDVSYLSRFSKNQLRLMRNEVLARHGYQFQAKDLQEHFASQSWYQPGNDNKSIKLSVIEQLNIQLIKSEEAIPDADRGYEAVLQTEAGNTATNGGEQVIVVKNEAEFLNALGSDREVRLGYDVHLNLSRILNNQEDFVNVKGRRWSDDASTVVSTQPMVISVGCFDGRQLTLKGFKNLTISGEYNASIEVDPRYAFCLDFINCSGIVIENLTIGHTEGGYCMGGVIAFGGGRRNVIKNCDLYGCGTYGIETRETNSLSVYDTTIHHCTYGILQLFASQAVKFFNCDFYNNKEFVMVESSGCDDIVFSKCRFYDNQGMLFGVDSTVTLLDSEVYHSGEIGSPNFLENPGNGTKFYTNDQLSNLQMRQIGPDSK